MKVRKLAVALALAGGLGSGVAQALGLGEIELQSYLNEPLDAEITLRKSEGVDPGDVFVNIASESSYERVGIDRNYFLTNLDFEVTTASDGSLVVNVTSREPLREPYLNFLLEVTWPNGRLMREYAVLVDPPVYAEESGVDEEVAAPATRQTSQPSRQQAQQRQPRSEAAQPESRRSTSQQARTLGPTGASDTLWKLAQRVRPDSSVSIQQVMLALQDANPDAFMGGNINRLKRGEVLRVPDIEDIRSRSQSEANRQVTAQNDAMSAPERSVDATEQQVASEQDGQRDAGGDELRLLASDESNSRDSEEGGSAGGDGDTAGGADAGSAVAMEELESARRENEELTGRVDDLQEQVETLQRLLELKNTQLAEIQTGEGNEGDAAGEVDPADEETLSDEVAEADPTEGEDTGESDATETEEAGDATDESVADASGDEEPGMAADDTDTAAEDAEMAEGDIAADQASDEPADDSEREEDAEVAAPSSDQPADEQATTPPAEPEKGFPDNIISAITNNPMYQIALGGGLILLLLLLLLLARRNANREKEFYDQLNSESEGEHDSFDLTLDDDENAAPADDPLAEADAYIAYGRMDQAAQSLETAISREPSRTDLRLKLLGVYADTQDRQSFEKQLGEIETLDDEQAIAEAHELRSRLEEAESMPSIDDLESQLRSDSFEPQTDDELPSGQRQHGSLDEDVFTDDFATGEDEAVRESTRDLEDDEFASLETDFSDLELDDVEAQDSERDPGPDDLIEYDLSGIEAADSKDSATADDATTAEEGTEAPAEALTDDTLDFSLEDDVAEEPLEQAEEDELSLELEDESKETAEAEDADEFDSLALDEGDEELTGLDSEELDELEAADLEERELEEGDLESLDESFLDELDAELDKVAGEEDVTPTGTDQNEMDDLELDVSDEDLALMEEFSDSGDSAATDQLEDDGTPLDEELGLEDALSDEEPADPEDVVAGAEELEDDLPELNDEDADQPPVASDAASSAARSGADIDEDDLGDDDDFDFLSGTDEAATKLDLARAYVEMGDVDGARDILEEVALEGNDEQKVEAQDLLKNLS